jgi:hypothetical protein
VPWRIAGTDLKVSSASVKESVERSAGRLRAVNSPHQAVSRALAKSPQVDIAQRTLGSISMDHTVSPEIKSLGQDR